MKVLHINNIASVSDALVSEQRKIPGYQVDILNIIPNQYKFTLRTKIITLFKRILLARDARRYINFYKPDIVHVHYSTSAIWMLGTKAKLVVHAHGSDIRLKKSDLLRRIVNKIAFRQADLLLYSTLDLKGYAEAYSLRSVFLPNPIDMDIYRCTNPIVNREENIKMLLFAAPTPVKGFSISSAAITEILARYKNVSVTIFKNTASIQFAKTNSNFNINLIDAVCQTDIANLISSHDVVLGQFIIGSYGMSELQTLACGKTLICNAKNNLTAFPDCPHMQAENKSEILKQFEKYMNLSDAEIILSAEKSRSWICRNHALKKIVKRLDVHYRE